MAQDKVIRQTNLGVNTRFGSYDTFTDNEGYLKTLRHTGFFIEGFGGYGLDNGVLAGGNFGVQFENFHVTLGLSTTERTLMGCTYSGTNAAASIMWDVVKYRKVYNHSTKQYHKVELPVWLALGGEGGYEWFKNYQNKVMSNSFAFGLKTELGFNLFNFNNPFEKGTVSKFSLVVTYRGIYTSPVANTSKFEKLNHDVFLGIRLGNF